MRSIESRLIRASIQMVGMAVILALAAACGDDDGQGPADAAVDAGADAGLDAGPDAVVTRTLRVVVRDLATTDGTNLPLAGATVALDPPGGDRIEQVTDAEGRTTFVDVALPEGSALAMTAHLEGYALASAVNVDATFLAIATDGQGDLPFLLPSLTPASTSPEMVTVTGSATGLADPAVNDVMLFPMRAQASYYRGDPAEPYSYDVEANRDFTVIALEGLDGALPSNRGYYVDVVTLASLEVGALAGDASGMDVDLAAHAVTPLRAEGTVTLPARVDSPLHSAWGMAFVKDWGSNLGNSCGWAEELERAADGSQYTVSWVWTEPAALVAPIIYFVAYDNAYNTSYVFQPGYPAAGELATPLLDVPRWVAPVNPALPHALHSPLEWELFDDIQNVQLRIARGEQEVWVVYCGPDATTATVPEPPSSADPAAILGEEGLTGTLWAGNADADHRYWVQLAIAQTITLNPL